MRLRSLFFIFLLGCYTSYAGTNIVAEANERPTSPAIPRQRDLPCLFIVGDSTVHNAAPGLLGWGDVIGQHFDTNKITVDNWAKPGRSSKTFQTQGWWTNLLSIARPGDFVLIQMGHNDTSPIVDTNRARGTLPGIGTAETNIFNPILGIPETVHTYGWYLRKYIAEARAKQMIPILCSPVPRLSAVTATNHITEDTPYIGWSEDVARTEKVFFINLNQRILDRYSGLTSEEVRNRYYAVHDGTHFNPAGAELNAACVMEGLRELKTCPLNRFVLAPGR